MILTIEGCFYSPIPETTLAQLLSTSSTFSPTGTPSPTSTTSRAGTPSSTSTPSRISTALLPITNAMNYCTEQKGMNQPLYIYSNQVKSNPLPDNTTEDTINPTSTNPGLRYLSTSPNPNINITLDQPATLTLIYLPVDRPNQPSNVKNFTVIFFYPNGSVSKEYQSQILPTSTTTTITTPTGLPTETTTTPSTNVIFPPSNISPRIDLSPNFNVPEKTILSITITSTSNEINPIGVCIVFD